MIAPLLLLGGGEYLSAFKPDQLQALALVFIRLRTIGLDIALGVLRLSLRRTRLPHFQVDFLAAYSGPAAGDWGGGILGQHFRERYSICDGAHLFPYIMLPAGIAEISLALSLLVIGVNVQRWKEASAAAAIRK
jgi:hypothetical protein